MVTQLDIGGISVDVVFKDIKNVHLSVYPPTGRVRIAAPCRMSLENIRLFAISKLGWIRKNQSKLLSQERETPREYLERESHYLWGQRYLLRIAPDEASGVVVEHRHIVLHVNEDAPLPRRQALLEDFYRREIKRAAPPMIAQWERQLGVIVDRFFVQRMKTRWGSSNPQLKTIRLNSELAKKPIDCLDYVVLHEMAHFIVPNHSERFVHLMDELMPAWRTVRQRLNEAALAL